MKYIERESRTLEFKSQISHFSKFIKTCVAFANGIGGKIIVGINDAGEIIGVDNEMRDHIYDEFPNSLYDSTSPNLLAEIYEKNFSNTKNVIVIEIFPSNRKPVYVKNEGIPHGVYLRVGSSTRRANEEYIAELMRENKRISYDEEAIHADLDILSEELLKTHFKKIDMRRLLSEKIICRSPAQKNAYYPTITGVLMFCEMPDIYLEEAVVRCTRFQGTSGRHIIQSEEIKGTLDKQIETSYQLIRSWLIRDYQLLGTKLKGKTIIPEAALREAIINALIHRKYNIPGSVKIALYDDRLEIFNPGNFPGMMDMTQLGDGTTYLRNPTLAKIARQAGIIEKLGTGIRLILDATKKAGLKTPKYVENADSIKVIFYFLLTEEPLESEEEKLLSLFAMRKILKIHDIASFMNISRNTATRKLNKLIQKGTIIRKGKGPNVEYQYL